MIGATLGIGKASALLPGRRAPAQARFLKSAGSIAGVALRSLLLYGWSGAWSKFGVAIRTRQIYLSPNEDRWLLARDPDTGRVFVRHAPNLPSGGQVADIEIGAFLIAAGNQWALDALGKQPVAHSPPRARPVI